MVLGGANTGSRLRRSKSAVSTNSRFRGHTFSEAISDETGQRQALTAASLAMQRASKSSSSHDSEPGTRRSYSQQHRPQGTHLDRGSSSRTRRTNSTHGSLTARIPGRRPEKTGEGESIAQCTGGVDEFGMLNDDIPSVPSVPSSYRKLRKSKSMFSTRLRSTILNDDSLRRKRSRRDLRDTAPRHFARTTLRRSISFFKGEDDGRASDRQHTDGHEFPFKEARDQFLRDLSRTSHSDQAGQKASGRRSSGSNLFRRTLRSHGSLNNDYGSGSSTHSSHDTPKKGGSVKARLFSQSIKNGFRRMFGRNSGNSSSYQASASSAQQEDEVASSSHKSDLEADKMSGISSNGVGGNHGKYNGYYEPLVQRPPSIRSLKSIDSQATSNSRVTSWTNSTATNTITARRPMDTRLSIISEHGDPNMPIHSSPSKASSHDGYSTFRQPLCLDGLAANAMDSQRVYSALMRRMDSANTRERYEGDPRGKEQSPAYSQRKSRSIRQVPSDGSMRYAQNIQIPPRKSPSVLSHNSSQTFYTAKSPGFTPQQVAERNENISRRRSQLLPNRFDSSTPRSQSRRYGVVYEGEVNPQRLEYSDDDDSRTIVLLNSASASYDVMSPSVYSRTTSGNTPSLYNDLDSSDSDNDTGTATIITSERLTCNPRDGARYLKGSAEWKNWMSSQMELIDRPEVSSNLDIQLSDGVKHHYREQTQIDSEPSEGEERVLIETKGEEFKDESEQKETEHPVSASERQPLLELKSIPQNNFSRPLRRSPSGAISFGSTSTRVPSLVTESHSSPCSAVVIDMEVPHSKPAANSTLSKTPNQSPLAYRRTRQYGSLRSPATPPRAALTLSRSSASARGRHGKNLPSPQQVGELKKAIQSVQFNPVRPKRDDSFKENRRKSENNPPSRNIAADELSRLSEFHSTISSKKMVDLFLSDRRRLRGSEDSTAESAFL